jgi:hypothetical protein
LAISSAAQSAQPPKLLPSPVALRWYCHAIWTVEGTKRDNGALVSDVYLRENREIASHRKSISANEFQAKSGVISPLLLPGSMAMLTFVP